MRALERLCWIEATVGNASQSLTVPLDEEAVGLLDAFAREHHTDARALHGFEAGFFGKGLGYVLRLAGALSLLQASETGNQSPTISADLFSRAAGLWSGYFWLHAQAALRVGGGSAQRRMDRKVLMWIKANRRETVRREDIRRDCLGKALDASQTDVLMGRLTKAGWTRPLSPRVGSGRPMAAWEINPVLFEGD